MFPIRGTTFQFSFLNFESGMTSAFSELYIINRHVNGPAWGREWEAAFGRGNNEVNPISDGKAIKKILNEALHLNI